MTVMDNISATLNKEAGRHITFDMGTYGFAGVMKRHGFGGFPGSHGTERKHRAPGSISSYSSNAGHGGGPKKGKRMSGHLGNRQVTTKNHKIVSIEKEKNLLVIKGPVPGPDGSYCIIRSAKKG